MSVPSFQGMAKVVTATMVPTMVVTMVATMVRTMVATMVSVTKIHKSEKGENCP